MTCRTASAVAAASLAFFATFVDARAADAVKVQDVPPAALTVAQFGDGTHAGSIAQLPQSAQSSRARGSSESILGSWTARYQGSLEQPARVTKIAVVTGQPSLAAPEKIGKLAATAVGPHARPGSGNGAMSLDGSGSANEDNAPGPYAMLLIGFSFAAFMVFRRTGHA